MATLFEEARPTFGHWLERIESHAVALETIGHEKPPQPRWRQDWFPRLDAAVAYTLVREMAPARIIEVGSGHSTRFFARAIADGSLATQLTAIDPAPRADISALPIALHRCTVQDADAALFGTLEPGDVLFIDSSHIAMPGSDVDLLFTTILPRLKPGVFVHVHDMLLPDGYPPDWRWRGYNEQTLPAALLGSGGWKVIFSSHFVATRMADRVMAGIAGRLPLPQGARETSLWMVKS
jgi:predicted O-methyltransferase YrrM